MKLTLVLLITGILQVSASTYAQNISISVKNVSLKKVLKELRQQTGYNFLYNSKMMSETAPVSLSVKNMPFNEALDKCFHNQPVTYVIDHNTVVIKRKPSISASAVQDITISGTVKDTKGASIPGVSVKLKGTTTGTVTNPEGNFSLKVPDGNSILVFSFIGFETQEITVNSNTANLNIILKEQSSALSEVVVTALGIKRSEQSLTYATQQISNSELTAVKTDNLMDALSGKVAGLIVSPSSSGVGGSAKVTLRGNRSAQGNNQPLYVIDGVPITNSGNGNMGSTNLYGGSDGGDGISNLNPEDIESMSVLEGASAAALYGSQAQNGVIVINTKKGKVGKAEIDFTSSASIDHVAYLPKFQNQYGETSSTVNTSWGGPISGAPDNLKAYFRNGVNLTNGISLSAGSEMAQTYFSYANTNATGVEPGNKLNRNNFNLNETGHFLNNKLTVNANVNYIDQQVNNTPNLGFYFNPLVSLYLFPRGSDILPYKNQYQTLDANGLGHQNWIVQGDDLHQENPWWIQHNVPNIANRSRFLINGSVKYDITSWLNVQVRGNVDRAADNYEQDIYFGGDPTFASSPDGSTGSKLNLTNQVLEQKYGDALLNFTIPLKHSDFKINGLIGGSITDSQLSGTTVSSNLAIPNLFTVGNTIATPANQSSQSTSNVTAIGYNTPNGPFPSHSQLQALFGSADFSYKNWVYLTVTGRNDWSSNLSYTPNDSYFYPSAGLSVILSQIAKLPEAISYAKIRGSYAQVGNTVPPYLTNIQNTEDRTGAIVFNEAAAFRTLKPEKTKSFELGTDLRFLDNRINFSFTYYKTNTINQYFSVNPSAATLNTYGYINAGNIENYGAEFIIGADVVKGPGLNWNTSINGSLNRNKILYIDPSNPDNPFIINSGDKYANELVKGGSYGDIYGTTLLKDAQGRVVLSGNGTAGSPYAPQAAPGAFQYLGNPNPKFQLGWSNTFKYQNFSLSFLVDGKFGGQVLSYTQAYLDAYGVSKVTGDARAAGGVKVNGVNSSGQPVTTVTALGWYPTSNLTVRDGAIASQYIYSATVVRLREASLGYTLPVANSAFKSVRLSLVGRNLIYFYKKAPFDPELTSSDGNANGGIDMFGMPATRNIGLNLNVTF
jgi:TonB-linked SusC/RagA family outer membrane protein